MTDKNAQNELDTKYGGVKKTTQKEIVEDGTADKWTGELIIDDYAALELINITDNKIQKLVIKNCPKLKKIDINDNKIDIVDLSGIGTNNVLEDFFANENQLTELNLKNCAKIKKLKLRENATLGKIKGLEDIKDIDEIDLTGTPNVRLVHEDKFGDYEQTKEAIKDLIGDLSSAKGSDGKIDKGKLKDELGTKASGSQISDLLKEINGAGLGLTGSDITKDKIITKIKELKQQVTRAVNDLLKEINDLGLGLTGADITKEKVLEKIKKLIKRPTRSDYDTIKAENDLMKDSTVKKEDMVESDKVVLGKLGISLADYEGKIVDVKASEVEKIRNGLIEKRFGELSNEKNTAFYLNIGLSVLVIGSLAAIIWLVLRENNPKTEPEPEKIEK